MNEEEFPRLEVDEEGDCMYLYIQDGLIDHTESLTEYGFINADVDIDNKILGIEILSLQPYFIESLSQIFNKVRHLPKAPINRRHSLDAKKGTQA